MIGRLFVYRAADCVAVTLLVLAASTALSSPRDELWTQTQYLSPPKCIESYDALVSAFGPRASLPDFEKKVGGLTVPDWTRDRKLFRWVRDGDPEHFGGGFWQMATRSVELRFDLDVILRNEERLKQLKNIFEAYIARLKGEGQELSFYRLSKSPGYNQERPSPDLPTFTELELFIIVSNEPFVAKTRFYQKNSAGSYEEISREKILETFDWMRPLFTRSGETTSLWVFPRPASP